MLLRCGREIAKEEEKKKEQMRAIITTCIMNEMGVGKAYTAWLEGKRGRV